jgi:hypothetical protein
MTVAMARDAKAAIGVGIEFFEIEHSAWGISSKLVRISSLEMRIFSLPTTFAIHRNRSAIAWSEG